MSFSKTTRIAGLALASLTFAATPSPAGQRHGPHGGGGGSVQRAVPRSSVGSRTVVVRPAIVGAYPYRPYYYGYRPGFSFNLYYGLPFYGYYGYTPYGYYYPYSYYYPYGYAYPYGSSYPYPYGYPYGYYNAPPAGYPSTAPVQAYGGVRILDAPRDAEVFADGYSIGRVDDVDGVFQDINLEAGPHRIEIRAPGFEPMTFDVRVNPGETITYRAGMRREK